MRFEELQDKDEDADAVKMYIAQVSALSITPEPNTLKICMPILISKSTLSNLLGMFIPNPTNPTNSPHSLDYAPVPNAGSRPD